VPPPAPSANPLGGSVSLTVPFSLEDLGIERAAQAADGPAWPP